MEPMSFRERFIGFSSGNRQFAPSTIGAPEYISQVDYSVFKKNPKEKADTIKLKKSHKRDLVKFYGKGKVGKRLNISLIS